MAPRILTSVLARGEWVLYSRRKNLNCPLHTGLGGPRNRSGGPGTDKNPLLQTRFKPETDQTVGPVSFVLTVSVPA